MTEQIDLQKITDRITDQFDRFVTEAFGADPLVKYGATVTVLPDGGVIVWSEGESVRILPEPK